MTGNKKDKEEQWKWYDSKYEMAEFLLEKLTNYKESFNKSGYAIPNWIAENEGKKDSYTEGEIEHLKLFWNKEIDMMITAFKQILNYKLGFDEDLEYNENEIQQGLNAFAKHFLHF